MINLDIHGNLAKDEVCPVVLDRGHAPGLAWYWDFQRDDHDDDEEDDHEEESNRPD